jgi:predicted nucleic acid-binding protein
MFDLIILTKNRKVFLDTSVIFAAVLSEKGGARKVFLLGEAGVLQLIVGRNVLRECEDVIRRKVPESLPRLAYLMELGGLEIVSGSVDDYIQQAKTIVSYEPDAFVLAEAMAADPDWFITHDKTHFLDAKNGSNLSFIVGTPGDLFQALEDEFHEP